MIILKWGRKREFDSLSREYWAFKVNPALLTFGHFRSLLYAPNMEHVLSLHKFCQYSTLGYLWQSMEYRQVRQKILILN